MPLIEEKRIIDRTKRGHAAPLLTSLGGVDYRVSTAVVKAMPVKFEKKQLVEKPADYSSWNMPLQEDGVIKCREHEFW